MVEENMPAERRALTEWLASSGFLSCDAVDVFDAVEEIADFTVGECPDVIVLDVDCCSEKADLLRTIMRSGRNEPSILTYTRESTLAKKGLDLTALSARLNTLITQRRAAH
jgi:DNA-binding response OmpR family regulator